MDLKSEIMEFRCKEKLLPHYVGRMVYAYDIVHFDVMEGKLPEEMKNGKKSKFRILFFGGSDIKNVLRTVAGNLNLEYDFHLVDSNPHIQVTLQIV
jgi:hypothetical protein